MYNCCYCRLRKYISLCFLEPNGNIMISNSHQSSGTFNRCYCKHRKYINFSFPGLNGNSIISILILPVCENIQLLLLQTYKIYFLVFSSAQWKYDINFTLTRLWGHLILLLQAYKIYFLTFSRIQWEYYHINFAITSL